MLSGPLLGTRFEVHLCRTGANDVRDQPYHDPDFARKRPGSWRDQVQPHPTGPQQWVYALEQFATSTPDL